MSAIKQFIKYKLKAKNAHGIHSPFVFDLYNNVFDNKHAFYVFQSLELMRENLLLSNQIIEVEDFGAGSQKMKSNKRKIKDIAEYSALPSKYAAFLFRLINYFQPNYIIETGTSLGLTTIYLAEPNPHAQVLTFEGCKESLNIAKKTFVSLKINNIETKLGKIEDELPKALKELNKVDFALIDADHRFESTMKQFETLLEFCHNDSILVFDDIYWSKGMTKAWEEIKSHKRVTMSIDIYRMGLIFFRDEFKNKQHFMLKY